MKTQNEHENRDAALQKAFDILGLSESERKILLLSRVAKSMSAIARYSEIPRGSLPTIMKRLEGRHLVRRIGLGHKQELWKSDIRKATRIIARAVHDLPI
ncbi:MAG: hypothetical protein Q8L64_05580 [bacterium]|nr:hypothetical protein [bacterium]